MDQADAMICPQCGFEMNYHAEKVDYMAAQTNPDAIDSDFGGSVEAIHTCPGCGNIGTRQVSAAANH